MIRRRHRRGRRPSYCSARCRREAKLRRDRRYREDYRQHDGAQQHKAEENRRYREAVDWARYVRYWRKADPEKRGPGERVRAWRYYWKHREQILAKARVRRLHKKQSETTRSH